MESTLGKQTRRLTADEIDAQLRRAIEKDMESRTQFGLAADAGVSEPTVHHFRNRARGLAWSSAMKLIAALGLELRPRRVKAIQTRQKTKRRKADMDE